VAEHEIKLPILGEEGPDEATIAFFCVEEGDRVSKGQKIAEVLTDKASFDVVSPADGTVKRILAAEDETVKVGRVLAIIDSDQPTMK